MTRFTRDTALSVISQRNINPNMESRIIPMVITITMDDHRSNPSSTNVTTNIAAVLRLRLWIESWTIVRYCS